MAERAGTVREAAWRIARNDYVIHAGIVQEVTMTQSRVRLTFNTGASAWFHKDETLWIEPARSDAEP